MSIVEHSDVADAAIRVDPSSAVKKVSPHLYGLFIEDINYACDGGLNANVVNNHSFEGVYVERGSTPYASAELRSEIGDAAVQHLVALTPAGRSFDRARHWSATDGDLTISDDDPLEGGAHFARVRSHGATVIENKGYPGIRPSMGLTGLMTFRAWVRATDYRGDLEVRLTDADGEVTATATVPLGGHGWHPVIANLMPARIGRGALQLHLPGSGTLDIDEVTLVADDHWGAGDARWSQGVLRRDLVEALKGLAPRFIRFPGGCLVEGCGDGSQYRWKQTLGPIQTRRPEYNLWGQFITDGDYSQSNQIGFYEYFLLCEDLEAEPMPVVWAGVSCQVRTDHCVPMHSAEFAAVVQDAIDLIDWATGDPEANAWAALRAEAGHPEPFALNYLGIGNENYGPEYRARFEVIKAAVEAHRPGMSIIMSTTSPDAPDTADTWAYARAVGDRLVVDEHFYYSADWMTRAANRYDDYPRDTARVFIGEWSAYPPNVIGADRNQVSTVEVGTDPERPNTWASAVAEAAFLTGVERNSDVVSLVSYAPLLNLTENGQWAHNLIDFSPTEVSPTVNYRVQQLFATNVGEWIVPIDGALPDRVFASATADAETMYIKIVNSDSAFHRIVLHVGTTPDGATQTEQLSGPLTAANLLTFDGLPQIALSPQHVTTHILDGAVTLALDPASVIVLRVQR